MAKITDLSKANRYAKAIIEDIMLYHMKEFEMMEGKNYLNSKKIRENYDEGLRLFRERIATELEEENIYFKTFKKRLKQQFGDKIKCKLKD